jgi:hypothetical protein
MARGDHAPGWMAGGDRVAMCTQCMMGAMTAGAGATGIRAWLALRRPRWLTPERFRVITVALLASALVASATLIGGSGGS